ncbi:transposase [Candidatus Contendibacter odensensis]|uniref:Transposase IS204/IS1001/IS1096/IS1165 DDE domain-containing protein n=1 Tax=Candidatus Contendobacter odensis Run_B_J11 TaxID=1400861 RepID=A0A7U7GA78_9GAMM|nr:hypothetical protein BN874_1680011 [Candidatus Contendobacter odensis Run_B_J11]
MNQLSHSDTGDNFALSISFSIGSLLRYPHSTLQEFSKNKIIENKHLNQFLYMINNWEEYVLNYFTHRFTSSIIKGISNSIKTVKRMDCYSRNFVNFKQQIPIVFA